LGGAQVLDRDGRRAYAGVVEQNIQAAKPLHGIAEKCLYGPFVAHIRGHHEQPRRDARFGRGLFERVSAAPGQDHAITVCLQSQRYGTTYAAPRSRDNGDFFQNGGL